MNEDQISKKIKEELQNIKLTREEKSRMFERIISTPISSPYTPVKSRFTFMFSSLRYSLVLLLIILLGGISTTYASLESIPGDKLYPIKLKVAEPILDTLSFTSEAKAKREATKALNRLEEAEKLIEKDALTKESRIFLETEFKKHTDNFNTKIENSNKVKDHNKNELKAFFDVSLYKYTDNFEKIKSEKEKDENKEKNESLKKIQIEEATLLEKAILEKVVEKKENKSSNQKKIKPENRKRNIESKKSSVKSIILIGNEKINKTKDEKRENKEDHEKDILEVKAELEIAENILIEAEDKIEKGEEEKAEELLQDSYENAVNANIRHHIRTSGGLGI